jgi:hypothetical protein
MNLEQIVKETVAKIVAEKELTAAEEKKREEIVKAMKKDFKGPAPAMYAIATDKAKKLAEEGDHEVSMAQNSLDSILRSAMELKSKIGNQEINIPAWIQDHITNSENFIDQASQGYHEYSNGGHEEMNEGYNFEQSAIESASGDKITGTEEDDEGNTLYIGQDPYDQYFIVNGEIKHDNFQKGIKSVTIGMLKHYGDGQNHSADDDMYEAFQPKSSFDDYKIGDNVTVNGKKAKITNMKMDDETGERRARVRFEDGSTKEVSINSLDEVQDISDNELAQLQATADDTSKMPAERDAARNKIYTSRNKNTMTTNEGRSAEDLKQAQLEKAYDHLEKMKANTRLFSKEDIKKAEDRIDKLEAELDALAAKATNESLDETTVRRWQHYAGIK